MQVADQLPVAQYDSGEARRDTDVEHIADLTRNVYCLLGMPIDAIDMDSALQLLAGRRPVQNPSSFDREPELPRQHPD